MEIQSAEWFMREQGAYKGTSTMVSKHAPDQAHQAQCDEHEDAQYRHCQCNCI